MENNGPIQANHRAQTVGSPQPSHQPSQHGRAPQPKKKNNALKIVSIVVALIAAVLVVVLASWLMQRSSVDAQINDDRYQAVFFTNGQVYFGKLSRMNDGYYRLNDIFYLQAQSSDGEAENPQQATDEEASDVQLIKLGSEIHGPEDAMFMKEDQVLFFENLKDDGRVAESIASYYQDNSQD